MSSREETQKFAFYGLIAFQSVALPDHAPDRGKGKASVMLSQHLATHTKVLLIYSTHAVMTRQAFGGSETFSGQETSNQHDFLRMCLRRIQEMRPNEGRDQDEPEFNVRSVPRRGYLAVWSSSTSRVAQPSSKTNGLADRAEVVVKERRSRRHQVVISGGICVKFSKKGVCR
ncbi:hypothetical protein BJV74DRAFT_67978 [Russula compacta]|nr:hypothetical protein BJV74DRAFT_67978 [Russula compacta]